MIKKLKEKAWLAISDYISILTVCAAVFVVLFAMWTFSGQWPWMQNSYNSYMLQAKSWLEGRLDLGKNYPYLELAIRNGKYYVSFPPFPSYIMLPFALLGMDKADGWLSVISALSAGAYAFKIAEHFGAKKERGIMFALLLTVGSNWLFTAHNPWVWFIAQNMAFTLSLMAIYYALKGKAGLSLAFWACSVGCRPMQVLYIFVLVYILYSKFKKDKPDISVIDVIKAKWMCLIPMAVIALSYMILNGARFGNITEFGHNYLPEFAEQSANGQFSAVYMKENIHNLFRLPVMTADKPWEYQHFNGTCIFIVSPVLISYIAYIIREAVKGDKKQLIFHGMVSGIMIIHLLAITAHKTMGGAHFGNRYVNDILPFAYISVLLCAANKSRFELLNNILLFGGLTVNVIGTILRYQ